MDGGERSRDADSDEDEDEQIRFEDLTVNDDLPLLDRVVRYVKSQIALQRLCHVKMLAETAELARYVNYNTWIRFNSIQM
jgi:hypothetical protein